MKQASDYCYQGFGNKTISESKLINLAILITFFDPSFISNCFVTVGRLLLIAKIAILFIFCICAIKEIRIDSLVILISIFYIWLIIVTILNEGSAAAIINNMATVLGLAVYLQVGFAGNPINIIKNVRTYFFILCCINFVLTIMHPQGLYAISSGEVIPVSFVSDSNDIRYFLGHKNHIAIFLTPGIMSAAWLYLNREDKSLYYPFILLTLIESVLVDSINSLLFSIFFAIAIKLISVSQKIRKAPTLVPLIVVGILDIAITVFNVQDMLGVLGIFGRDASFSGRTTIWALAIQVIMQNPFVGYGYEDIIETTLRFNGFQSPHNMYFAILYYGGVIGFILFLAIIVYAIKPMQSYNNKTYALAKYTIVGILLMGIGESFSFGISYLIYPITFCYIESKLQLSASNEESRHNIEEKYNALIV